jgi:hypothetical protein
VAPLKALKSLPALLWPARSHDEHEDRQFSSLDSRVIAVLQDRDTPHFLAREMLPDQTVQLGLQVIQFSTFDGYLLIT